MPALTRCRVIRNAMINDKIITIVLFVKNTMAVHMEKAMAEWPDGIPPLSGVPL